jgi:hypothetical protein
MTPLKPTHRTRIHEDEAVNQYNPYDIVIYIDAIHKMAVNMNQNRNREE